MLKLCKFIDLDLIFTLQQIKAIADTGVKVIVSGGKVGELALHYTNKYKLMVVRLLSKWDLRRLCRAIGATPLPRLVSITPALHLRSHGPYLHSTVWFTKRTFHIVLDKHIKHLIYDVQLNFRKNAEVISWTRGENTDWKSDFILLF